MAHDDTPTGGVPDDEDDDFGDDLGEVDDDDDDGDDHDDAVELEALDKPVELLALHGVTSELFHTLRRWFEVPERVTIDLSRVDSAVAELGDPLMIAAFAMRKLQALNLLATPGIATTTDVVVAIVQDIQRALLQAPTMRLKVQAAETDWDAALAELSDPYAAGAAEVPVDAGQVDPEAERFHELHARLQEAMFAVLEASDGDIRVFR